MRIDARVLVPPLLAVLVLVLTVRLTSQALERSGAWRKPARAAQRPADPYAHLDGELARAQLEVDPHAIRDPFGFGAAPVTPRTSTTPRSTTPVPPPPPAQPVLTSITVSDDADPRATVRYNGRDYSLGVNGLFDEYRVRSISRTQVVLERNGEPVVLTLRKGE